MSKVEVNVPPEIAPRWRCVDCSSHTAQVVPLYPSDAAEEPAFHLCVPCLLNHVRRAGERDRPTGTKDGTAAQDRQLSLLEAPAPPESSTLTPYIRGE